MEIPDAVRRSLSELAAALYESCPGARWVRLEGAHATLKFIGEVSPAQAENIQEALGNIRASAPIDLRFQGLGFFPDARHPRVFWAGIEGGAALARLAAAIEDALAPLGIAREARDFHPHITLARFASPQGAEQLRRHRRAALPDFGSRARKTSFTSIRAF